jgi:hypothetical protein
MTAKNDMRSTSPTHDRASHGQDRNLNRLAADCHDVDLDAKNPVPQGLWHDPKPSRDTPRRGRPQGRRPRSITIEPPEYTELSDHHREEAVAALATLLRPLLTGNRRPPLRPESTDEL